MPLAFQLPTLYNPSTEVKAKFIIETVLMMGVLCHNLQLGGETVAVRVAAKVSSDVGSEDLAPVDEEEIAVDVEEDVVPAAR